MNYDRTLSTDTITEAVQQIEHSWDVTDATAAKHGHHIVYVLDLETGAGTHRAVFKATPEGKDPVCDTEARMQRILSTHTTIPVPEVYGVVDEHDSLPTPLLLQSHLGGQNHRGDGIHEMSTAAIEQIAHSTGRHLAELHSLDAVDTYGYVAIDPAETRTGGRPSTDREQIVVEDATDSWETFVDEAATELVSALADTRFADEKELLEPVTAGCADRLVGEFEPVVARIDHSLDNLLLDAETSAVTGMLDWEFCVAATPAYDIAFVVHSLADSFWSMLPDTVDHRGTVQASLLSGYEEHGPTRVIEQFHANEDVYNLLVDLHSALNFENWFDLMEIEGDRREHAAEQLRSRLRRYT